MDFRILGHLEVREAGLDLSPRREKQRALAVLLLHPNQPVATDSLVHALWGERPPKPR
jgi:DNA-binding SARP family transcriptional activator